MTVRSLLLLMGFLTAVSCDTGIDVTAGFGSRFSASEIGLAVAGQVDVDSYRHYLDDLLYAHDGANRGGDGRGPEHALARDNIVATFESFGLKVDVESCSDTLECRNIVATQLGAVYPDSYFVLGAHYDSVDNPGADDDASGVAGLLEVARVLSSYQADYTIKYIAFDLEESILVGSTAYVASHLDDDIRGMIMLEIIAWNAGEYTCRISGEAESDPLKFALAMAVNEYSTGLSVVVGGNRIGSGLIWGFSDHIPFAGAGFQACVLYEDNWWLNPCINRACDSVDTPDYIDYTYASEMVRSVAGFLADHAMAKEAGG